MDDLQALKNKLDALDGELLQAAERKALKAVGDLIQEAIVAKAPERTDDETGGLLAPGELKASIKSHVHVAADAGTLSGKTSNVVIAPSGPAYPVARWVEYGHANRPGSKRPNTPAHPFIRNAFDEVQQAAVDLYAETMATAIKEAINE
jgi:HK97 gp10 family phage protein